MNGETPDIWFRRWQERQRERLARLFETQGKCEHGYRTGAGGCQDCEPKEERHERIR